MRAGLSGENLLISVHRTGRRRDVNVLLHSLAEYFLSKRDRENAITLWQEVISDDVFAPLAPVEIAAARASQARNTINDGMSHISTLPKAAPD